MKPIRIFKTRACLVSFLPSPPETGGAGVPEESSCRRFRASLSSRFGRTPAKSLVTKQGGGFLALLFLLIALPLHAKSADLPNFHQTAPGIWRGAAPTEAGLRQLKAMGIKTVIDLRIAPKTVKKEGIYARSLGFRWINLPMGSDPPAPKEVSTLLTTLKAAPSSPVFVHCQHGADRTGCMIGIYRVTQQGWTYSQAFTEMRKDGFNPHWIKLREAVQSRAKS